MPGGILRVCSSLIIISLFSVGKTLFAYRLQPLHPKKSIRIAYNIKMYVKIVDICKFIRLKVHMSFFRARGCQVQGAARDFRCRGGGTLPWL